MTYQLFEGKDHASIYQKYRFAPPAEVKNYILQYLHKKVPHELWMKINHVSVINAPYS